ncbi:MAG: phosphoglycolate phosphatase [Gammaproteobacteria bacterium]|nr:phosphoglycolate phosphatase [Gammaproteobacteria bacterium]
MDTVLFDLDGTLADTAPDLALALDSLRADRGLAPLDLAAVRAQTPYGTEALLALALGLRPDDRHYEAVRRDFLARYAGCIGTATVAFPGVADTLAALEASGRLWGVVTNKPEELAARVLEGLRLAGRPGCLIGGDTARRRKPHPDPLWLACERLGRRPAEAVYVGDDHTDILAARAAGMPGLVALFGYAPADAAHWGADGVLPTPAALLTWLRDRPGQSPV